VFLMKTLQAQAYTVDRRAWVVGQAIGASKLIRGLSRPQPRSVPAFGEGLQTARLRAGYLSYARGVHSIDEVARPTTRWHLVSPTAHLVDFYWLSSSI
jgi:hypothetical protein